MIRSVAVTAGIRLALTALALVTSIVTARYLGQEGRGDYFFMVTLAATLTQLATLGLPASNTYLVAGRPSLLPSLTTNSAWIAIGAAGGAGTAVAVAADLGGVLEDTPTSYLWLAAALAPPSLFYMLGSTLLVGVGRIRAYNAAEVASRGTVFLALLAAGALGAGASGFVGAAIAAWTVSAVGVAALLGRGGRLRVRFDGATFRRGVSYAFKAYVITLLGFLVLRSNVFLLRREWGPGELGLYSIAIQVTDVLLILPQTVNLILFPRLVGLERGRWPTTLRAAALVGVAMTAACLAAVPLARPAIRLLFGGEFEPAADVLYVLLPGVVLFALSGPFGQYLGSVGLPRRTLLAWAGAFALLVALSLVLIPGRAGAGAALALSVAQGGLLVGLALLAYGYHRSRPGDEPDGPSLHAEGDRAPVVE